MNKYKKIVKWKFDEMFMIWLVALLYPFTELREVTYIKQTQTQEVGK